MTGLSFIALFVVITVSLCPFMVSEAQRLGPSVTNTLNNPFGGAYELPPQIVMTYNNTEHLGVLDSYSFKVSETLGEIPIFNDTIISTIQEAEVVTYKNHQYLLLR